MYQSANDLQKNKTRRVTTKDPSSFKQLIAFTTVRTKNYHRMSIELKPQDLLNFTSKSKENTFSKNKKALDSFQKEKNSSNDLEFVRSNSTPKMVSQKDLKSNTKTKNDSKAYLVYLISFRNTQERIRRKQLSKLEKNMGSLSHKSSISSSSALSQSKSFSDKSPETIKLHKRLKNTVNEISKHLEYA